MNISHIRKDGSRVETMKGVKAPVKANRILSKKTFGEVLKREERKLDEEVDTCCGASADS